MNARARRRLELLRSALSRQPERSRTWLAPTAIGIGCGLAPGLGIAFVFAGERAGEGGSKRDLAGGFRRVRERFARQWRGNGQAETDDDIGG